MILTVNDISGDSVCHREGIGLEKEAKIMDREGRCLFVCFRGRCVRELGKPQDIYLRDAGVGLTPFPRS